MSVSNDACSAKFRNNYCLLLLVLVASLEGASKTFCSSKIHSRYVATCETNPHLICANVSIKSDTIDNSIDGRRDVTGTQGSLINKMQT